MEVLQMKDFSFDDLKIYYNEQESNTIKHLDNLEVKLYPNPVK
jgi:uncharacterized protein YqfB (UPF0267 family)